MKSLCLLDLDHTLIYGSYAPSEESELLFSYSEYLKVYKRPFAEGFVDKLKQVVDDIVVFTTAKEDYARQICDLLKIEEHLLLSREDCQQKDDHYYKNFRPEWGQTYDKIYIVDDSPNVWLGISDFEHKITFLTPREFRGEKNDDALEKLKCSFPMP